MDDSYDGLDDWLTRCDGFTRDAMAGLVADGLARYDPGRGAWIIHGGGEREPFEVRNVDAPLPAEVTDEIDRAISRFEDGLPPADIRDSIIYGALLEADASPAHASRWRERLIEQLEATAPGAWYELSYAAGDHPGLPVTAYDEDAAVHTARRMSHAGEPVIVEHVTRDGSRRLIGRFGDITEALADPGRPAGPGRPGPPPAEGPVPAAAGTAGQPVPLPPGDPRATRRQFPGGISPLPAPATAGGPIRPARLLYPDGQPLDCRPLGRTGPVWPGTAAGVVAAEGDLAPGWLQVVSRADGTLVSLHPALVSPRDVNPYAWLPYREQHRSSEFDTAEASGQTAVWLQAMFLNDGDQIRTETGDIRQIQLVTWDSESALRITTAGPSDTSSQLADRRDWIEVMIPARHPAEATPAGARLFALPAGPHPPAAGDLQAHPDAEITGLRQAMTGLRGQHAAPPRHAPAGPPGWSPAITMSQALQRGPHGARQAASGPPAGAAPAQPGWRVLTSMAATMQRAQDLAAGDIPGLPGNRTWRRLRSLTADARRVAADASSGRLRFGDPAVAFRAWRAVWARTCELTCDLAARVMDGLRPGGQPWHTARALHHAAAEAVAHARRWLPRDMRLPAGSYEPPGGRRIAGAPAWAKADAAARLHQAGAGPLRELDFPGPLAGVTARRTPSPRDRQRAARIATSRQAAARTAPPGRA
jgi:hypothetical protein